MKKMNKIYFVAFLLIFSKSNTFAQSEITKFTTCINIFDRTSVMLDAAGKTNDAAYGRRFIAVNTESGKRKYGEDNFNRELARNKIIVQGMTIKQISDSMGMCRDFAFE